MRDLDDAINENNGSDDNEDNVVDGAVPPVIAVVVAVAIAVAVAVAVAVAIAIAVIVVNDNYRTWTMTNCLAAVKVAVVVHSVVLLRGTRAGGGCWGVNFLGTVPHHSGPPVNRGV